jgi:hypothetical protein
MYRTGQLVETDLEEIWRGLMEGLDQQLPGSTEEDHIRGFQVRVPMTSFAD